MKLLKAEEMTKADIITTEDLDRLTEIVNSFLDRASAAKRPYELCNGATMIEPPTKFVSAKAHLHGF